MAPAHVGKSIGREAQCCSFFEFATRREDRAVVLDIKVPATQEAVLDGLARQAVSAASRAA